MSIVPTSCIGGGRSMTLKASLRCRRRRLRRRPAGRAQIGVPDGDSGRAGASANYHARALGLRGPGVSTTSMNALI